MHKRSMTTSKIRSWLKQDKKSESVNYMVCQELLWK